MVFTLILSHMKRTPPAPSAALGFLLRWILSYPLKRWELAECCLLTSQALTYRTTICS